MRSVDSVLRSIALLDAKYSQVGLRNKTHNTHVTDYSSSKECSRKKASNNSTRPCKPAHKVTLKRKVGYEVDDEEATMRRKTDMLLD